jgi:Core-2/I-Branching enzyme
MRLAHLVLAHNNPTQLERLVKRLIYHNTDIYIHLDAKADIKEFIHLQTLENVFFISNRTQVTWADFSMMAATLTSFEEILKTGKNYSHINLLSGHDYPLKRAADIQAFLFKNPDKTFMRYRSIYDEWSETLSRFTKYHLGDYKFPFRFRLQWLMNKLLPAKKLPNGLKPYGFSQWLTITPVCARYVIDYLKENPKVKRFFKLTWGSDELVFQTILLNSNLKDTIVNDHLRYIKFADRGYSPKILTMEDSEILVTSNRFYARKFDPGIDSKILDHLDRTAGV